MPARTPEESPRLWAENFVAGDLDALIALYEADATFSPIPRSRTMGLAV
jgi:ketosteroid isomerase-like protein